MLRPAHPTPHRCGVKRVYTHPDYTLPHEIKLRGGGRVHSVKTITTMTSTTTKLLTLITKVQAVEGADYDEDTLTMILTGITDAEADLTAFIKANMTKTARPRLSRILTRPRVPRACGCYTAQTHEVTSSKSYG